jgi:hypothetical protein
MGDSEDTWTKAEQEAEEAWTKAEQEAGREACKVYTAMEQEDKLKKLTVEWRWWTRWIAFWENLSEHDVQIQCVLLSQRRDSMQEQQKDIIEQLREMQPGGVPGGVSTRGSRKLEKPEKLKSALTDAKKKRDRLQQKRDRLQQKAPEAKRKSLDAGPTADQLANAQEAVRNAQEAVEYGELKSALKEAAETRKSRKQAAVAAFLQPKKDELAEANSAHDAVEGALNVLRSISPEAPELRLREGELAKAKLVRVKAQVALTKAEDAQDAVEAERAKARSRPGTELGWLMGAVQEAEAQWLRLCKQLKEAETLLEMFGASPAGGGAGKVPCQARVTSINAEIEAIFRKIRQLKKNSDASDAFFWIPDQPLAKEFKASETRPPSRRGDRKLILMRLSSALTKRRLLRF